MKNKPKIFYLDFIRALSMIIIVTYHFYAHFAENNIAGFRVIFSDGKWGLIGVAMFFMISGAALMFNYQEGIEIKTYAKKRFRGIYPMFWIAFSISFLINYFINKGYDHTIPIYRIIPHAVAVVWLLLYTCAVALSAYAGSASNSYLSNRS